MRTTVATVALVLALSSTGCSGGDRDSGGRATPATAAMRRPSPAASLTPTPIAGRVQRRLPLPGGPDYIGISDDSVWVKRDDGTLVRLDPVTMRTTATVRVAKNLCQGLGVSGNEIWACTDGGVVRVDPATNKVVATVTIAKSADQGPIPIGLGHAWVLTDGGATLVGISSATNRVAVEVPLGTRCADAAVSADALWVACFGNGTALRVDPVARAVTARVSGLGDARRIAATTPDVWVGYGAGLARLDPVTGDVKALVDAAPGSTGSLVATGESVWVRSAQADRFLRRVDIRTNAVVELLTAPEPSGGSVAVGFGSVWTTSYDDDVLYRLRP